MKSKILGTILLLVLAFATTYAQDFNKPKLDSLFSVLAENNKAMGSLVIAKNGKVIYNKTFGYSLILDDKKIPANELTKYRIGSITKMFTATMIFQLIEEGKINLNTTIEGFFPGLPNAGKITIGNMLNHHSGIHNFTNDPDYTTWMTQPKTETQMLAIIARAAPDFEPGTKASYSNANYVLLGYILEHLTNQSYSENLQQRITSVIKLNNTYVGGKTNIENNESLSYEFSDGWKPLPETDMSIPGGAGSIVSTPTDLAAFIYALFRLKLVSQSSLDQMKTITDGYGMGMVQVSFNEKRAYAHNGGIDGFASSLGWFPDEALAMAYCTNGVAYPMNDILIGVLSIFFNRQYSIPAFNALTLNPETLDKYLGVYSSTQLPLKITISKDHANLVAQATGQPSFPLEAKDIDVFTFDSAGIVMEFNPGKNEMTLKQAGKVFVFTKESADKETNP